MGIRTIHLQIDINDFPVSAIYSPSIGFLPGLLLSPRFCSESGCTMSEIRVGPGGHRGRAAVITKRLNGV
jgi:hypothetical protein